MKIAKTIIFGLLGLIMINAGLNKFFNYMPMPELTPEQAAFFEAFTSITWLMPLTALAEIIGGVLLFIPKFRTLGALILFPVCVGIFTHHLVTDRSGLIMGGIVLLVDVWILYNDRHRLLSIIDEK